MAKLLWIQSSPRGSESFSRQIALQFVKSYETAHPGDDCEIVDIWNLRLPEVSGIVLAARYQAMRGEIPRKHEARAWKKVSNMATHFSSADKYLFSVPMWNFALPYRLKHYLDVITQPGLTFAYSPEQGYCGLVRGKPVCVIYARGESYAPGSGNEGMDFLQPYTETLLRFIGFSDINQIIMEPTEHLPDEIRRARNRAIAQAERIAIQF